MKRSGGSHILVTSMLLVLLVAQTACENPSEVLTPTATHITITSAVSTQRDAPPNQPATASKLPNPASEPTELPAQTATPMPTARATSTPQPTLTPTNTPTPTPIPPTPDLQKLAAQYPQLAAILDNPAVGAAYKELLGAYQQGGVQSAMIVARQRGLLSPDGNVLATLMVNTENTSGIVSQLQTMGIKVLGVQGNQINVAMPLQLIVGNAQQPGAVLSRLSSLQNVTGISPPVH